MAYDYLIIGGGSAGCVLANRLSADPACRVCLLEAGPADRSPLIRIPIGIIGLMRSRRLNWAYWTEPQAALNGRRLYWPRGRTLGGSSAINAMCYTRGHPADFDAWREYAPGWDWQTLLPYFRRSEANERGADAWHGDRGPLSVSDPLHTNPLSAAFVEAAQAAGHAHNSDFNGATQEGVGLYQLMQRNGRRCSNAHAYLHPVRGRPNLTVITGAQATRVLLEGARAVGVEYRHRGRTRELRAQREVLLCGGAVNSPQLLMLSGLGPASELEELGIPVVQGLPGVGGNLQDHLDIALVCRARGREGVSLGPSYAPRALRGAWRWARGLPGEWNSNLAEAGGFARSRPEAERPDLQFHFLPAIEQEHGLNLHGPMRYYGYTLRVCDLQPASRGRIHLRSADPRDTPRIEPNYLAEPADLERLIAAYRIARGIMAQPPLARRQYSWFQTPPAGDERRGIIDYLRAHAESIYHPVGTCRFGEDEDAVVDGQLRVHGMAGLRVVDASVMPRINSGNTNALVTAIAERAADLILGEAGP